MKNLKANWPKNFPKPIYSNRFERNKYASILIKKYFSDASSILNIGGGGKRHLEKCFEENSNIKITEVDFSGNNDLNINLDKIDKLPFENNSFDISVALDSLEHFENFHGIFSEMFRISKKYIIISLPNSVETFFEILKHAKEDEGKKESVEIHNSAEQLVYQTESQLKDSGDKLSDNEKKPIENALDQLKQANGGSDIESIKTAIESLNKAWEPVAQKMYQAAQEESPATEASDSDSSNINSKDSKEEVEDADFEVVEDEK